MSHNEDNKAVNLCEKCKNCPCHMSQNDLFKNDNVKDIVSFSRADVINNVLDTMSILYEKFYSSLSLSNDIKSVNMLSNVDNCDNLGLLISISNFPGFNTVLTTKYVKLSKNFRVGLTRNCDALEGIEIACVNPKEDIESVTLFGSFFIPNDDKDLKSLLNFNPKQHFSSLPEYVFDEKRGKMFYFPIKKITNFDSNYVKFFDCPILLCAEMFTPLSIEVKYKSSIDFLKIVGLKHLTFTSKLREHIIMNHSLFERQITSKLLLIQNVTL